MALNSYADVQAFLNKVLSDNGELDDTKKISPHGDWWNTTSYQDFVTGNVPNVTDPNTGNPIPILVKGNSGQSNIILSLRGTAGTIFDPNNPDPAFPGRMPADAGVPPKNFFTDDQIKQLADWIDAGCPQ